jgi:hypothetical protein
MEFAFTPSHTYNMAIGGELARKNNMASRAKLAIVAIELEIEDMGIVVILEKKSDNGNDMDGKNGFNFATQWHISDKMFCDGVSGVDENCNGIQRIAPSSFVCVCPMGG